MEALCTLTLTNTWGQFEFRAERMEPVGDANRALIGVTIQHLVPREVRHVVLLKPNDRQENAAMLYARGCTARLVDWDA